MKPENIKVGTKYSHPDYPDHVWLGAGIRRPFTTGLDNDDFTYKCLVLIKRDDDGKVGFIFKTVEEEYGSFQEDWDLFAEIEE